MTKKVIMWEDDFGELHRTQEEADRNTIDAKKKDLLCDIYQQVSCHMNYDEFLVDDFVQEADEMIDLLNRWKKLNEL